MSIWQCWPRLGLLSEPLARASSNWKQLFIDVKKASSSSCVFVAIVVRALERYSKDLGLSPGGDTCFSHQ